MTIVALEKVAVERKESGAAKLEKKWNELMILHAFSTNLVPYLSNMNTLRAQKLPLAFGKIFI